jgi:hypothetical protein
LLSNTQALPSSPPAVVRRQPFSRARRVARILFGIAWTLFACEIFLRIFAPQPLMPRNVTASNFGVRVNTPSQSYWQKTPEVHVQVRINSQGIRADEEIPLAKPPGVKRIVVLGDSYGMGYEVDLKDAFTTQMANLLNAAGQRVQVVNLSVSGYGNAEELLMLRHRGLEFHPDLVLLAWHDTDLDDNIRSQLFSLRDGKLVRDQPAYLPGVKTRQMLDHIPGYSWLEANSMLYAFVRERAAGKMKDLLAATRGGGGPAVAPVPVLNGTIGPATRPAAVPSYSERLTVALLAQIRDDCEQHGAKFLILDIPTWRSRTQFASRLPLLPSEGAAKLDVVSPLNVFKSHVGEKLFWERGHYHFTVLGCQLVGQVLAEQILNEKLLETESRGSSQPAISPTP